MVYQYLTPKKYNELVTFLAIHNTSLDSVCFIEVKDDSHILLATDCETLINALVNDNDLIGLKKKKNFYAALFSGIELIELLAIVC